MGVNRECFSLLLAGSGCFELLSLGGMAAPAQIGLCGWECVCVGFAHAAAHFFPRGGMRAFAGDPGAQRAFCRTVDIRVVFLP